jgi:phospholipase D-like protein
VVANYCIHTGWKATGDVEGVGWLEAWGQSSEAHRIDGQTVITGSFNFTKAAQEKHAEHVLIIRDPALAAQYTQN